MTPQQTHEFFEEVANYSRVNPPNDVFRVKWGLEADERPLMVFRPSWRYYQKLLLLGVLFLAAASLPCIHPHSRPN